MQTSITFPFQVPKSHNTPLDSGWNPRPSPLKWTGHMKQANTQTCLPSLEAFYTSTLSHVHLLSFCQKLTCKWRISIWKPGIIRACDLTSSMCASFFGFSGRFGDVILMNQRIPFQKHPRDSTTLLAHCTALSQSENMKAGTSSAVQTVCGLCLNSLVS